MKLPRFHIDDETKQVIDETRDKAKELSDRALNLTDRILRPELVLPLFLAALVLLVLISSVVVVREHRRANGETTAPVSETVATVGTDEAKGTLQGNFLLALTDQSFGTIRMLAVVRADSEVQTLSVCFVSPADRAEVNNLNGSMQQHFDKGGATELAWAVGARTARTIDRYIIVNSDRMAIFCKNLGEHELTIDAAVEAEYDGIAFVIKEGKQTLTSDTLCKYFGFCCKTLYQGNDEKVSSLLEYLIQKLLSSENESRFDRILSKLISDATTNISAMDLQEYSAVRPAFLKDGAPVALTNEGVFRPGTEVEN